MSEPVPGPLPNGVARTAPTPPTPASAPPSVSASVPPSSGEGDGQHPDGAQNGAGPSTSTAPRRPRRRGSRGGRNRRTGGAAGAAGAGGRTSSTDSTEPVRDDGASPAAERRGGASGGGRGGRARPGPQPVSPVVADPEQPELPKRLTEGRPSPEAAAAALIRKPKIGDSRPAPPPSADAGGAGAARREAAVEAPPPKAKRSRRRGGRGRGSQGQVVDGTLDGETPLVLDEETLEKRRGRERKGRPIGRYLMVAQCRENATQVAVLEGRSLIEHYVSRPTDDTTQIHGNIYLGRVQNVLPGMEAAFVDIGTPKNAVLYRGDVQYDAEDVEEKGGSRIEQLLRPGQTVLCQVTKNPISTKGARLTQEVSMAGRFVVFIPNSSTYGISKRLADDERKRLRKILDDVRPSGHGLIVRTAAEGATPEELRRDVERLKRQWQQLDALAKRSTAPCLLYREPPLALRVIREEFNRDYRGVVIDEPALYQEVKEYVEALIPELAGRVELYDDPTLPVFERHHVHEQLHKALDRKVWLPSGGSVIIERTEALTVIDVNTGKNVGSSNLEETVFRNNLEAADEIARQLRLRDIGGIIVIDFIDMEVKKNREEVLRAFKDALARDKTRTQVFDMSELGLVEMTRKRVSEGLVESFSATCPTCAGRGFLLDETLLG